MRSSFFWMLVFLASCAPAEQQDKVVLSGRATAAVEFLTIGPDTIIVKNGLFLDTLSRANSQYNYLKLSNWKWPRIIHLAPGKELNLNFSEEWTFSENDKLNEFLLNKDSILVPYSAKWDMTDVAFRNAWQQEFPLNLKKITAFFAGSNTQQSRIEELQQMEYMLRGHLTANFISFQERKGVEINRDIYGFVDSMDLNNERLAFHENNRNFQYYYYLDKVSDELPDSIYPFAVIDTAKKYVGPIAIRNMIIRNVVKAGFYEESVNHDALLLQYEENIGEIAADDDILKLYDRIQQLKPGNPAPAIGELINREGGELSLEDFKEKNILLSIWGTWCPYCKEELPHLKELMSKFPDKFENVAISLDTDEAKWKNYISEYDWQGTHLIDPNRKSVFRTNYLIRGTNRYFLINKNGTIVSADLKPSNELLEKAIQGLGN